MKEAGVGDGDSAVKLPALIPEELADRPPAQKLVYLPLVWYPPLRPLELIAMLNHSGRTIRHALNELAEDGFIQEISDPRNDLRATFYTVSGTEPSINTDSNLPVLIPKALEDLSPAQKLVYLATAAYGPIRTQELADVLYHSVGTVRHATSILQDRGWLCHCEDGHDRRARYYGLAESTPLPTPPRAT